MARYSVDCWIDKAERVRSVLQEMGCFSHLWRQVFPAPYGTIVTITLESGREMQEHHHERLSQLVFDGDAITLYPEIDEEELRQWEEQQADIERLDGKAVGEEITE